MATFSVSKDLFQCRHLCFAGFCNCLPADKSQCIANMYKVIGFYFLRLITCPVAWKDTWHWTSRWPNRPRRRWRQQWDWYSEPLQLLVAAFSRFFCPAPRLCWKQNIYKLSKQQICVFWVNIFQMIKPFIKFLEGFALHFFVDWEELPMWRTRQNEDHSSEPPR